MLTWFLEGFCREENQHRFQFSLRDSVFQRVHHGDFFVCYECCYLQKYSVLTSFAEAAGGSPKMGIGALQQCEGLSGYISNGCWSKILSIGHLQWNSVAVWQVCPTGKTAASGFLPIFWDVPRANIHAVED